MTNCQVTTIAQYHGASAAVIRGLQHTDAVAVLSLVWRTRSFCVGQEAGGLYSDGSIASPAVPGPNTPTYSLDQSMSSTTHAASVLKGAALARRLRNEIAAAKEHLADLGAPTPVLATLLTGDNPAAKAYRASIERTFRKVDIEHRAVELPATTTEGDFVEAVSAMNEDPSITGILVLMPLPDHLDSHLVLEHLSPLKDVDGITPTNAGRLHLGLPSLRPSTPAGGLELLDFHKVKLEGTQVTVVGRSNVVGRPLATLLTQRNATVTLCHRKTENLAEEVRRASVVCVAAGHAGLITEDMVRPGATVLDFGVNVLEDGRVVGDVDFEAVARVAGAITPVPGGTGPVTALVLARNTLAAGFAALDGNLDAVLFELPEHLTQRIAEAELAHSESSVASMG